MNRVKRKARLFILLLLIIGIALVGCKKKEETEENENNNNNNNEPELNLTEDNNEDEIVEEEEFKYVYPLTGIKTNEDVSNRPVGVMINNHPAARPQSGLSKADLVFEILAEGATTRFLALFQSEMPDIVGPVRSAREYYFELARDYDALYVYHGAANFVNDMIINRGIEHLNGAYHDNDQKLFKRESFRKAPHNSYLLMDNAYDFAQAKGYEITSNLQALDFLPEEEELIKGSQANHAKIGYIGKQPYYRVEYKYDEESKAYIRSSDGVEDKELNDDSPLLAHNLLILETYHEVFDNDGRRKIDMKSSGKALLLQRGKMQEVTWENRDGIILPVKDGEVLPLVPGKTWINVVPSLEQSVEISTE